jgi:hypothetical protein
VAEKARGQLTRKGGKGVAWLARKENGR